MLRHCALGWRLRKAGVVQLKTKFADFNIITRRTTLGAATDDGQALSCAALELLESAHQGKPIRLRLPSITD
jgi:DNA polymerase-4